MTTVQYQNARHSREAICPPWCDGHNGLSYQNWEDAGPEGMRRDHMSAPRYVNEVSPLCVSEGRIENAPGILGAPFVEVYSDDAADLTPTEARELARLLLESADRAEAHQ